MILGIMFLQKFSVNYESWKGHWITLWRRKRKPYLSNLKSLLVHAFTFSGMFYNVNPLRKLIELLTQ